MKTNYAKIDLAVKRLEAARNDLNHIASLRIGVISGGPSIDEETAEFETALSELIQLTKSAIKNGCRLSTLLEHLDGELVTTDIVKDEIREREYSREFNVNC